MHLVHHAAEEMDLSVSLRHPWFIFIFSSIPLYLFAFAGVSPLMLFSIASGSFAVSFWTHSAIIPKLGWLERFLITPSLHRVHHAKNPEYLDKNFGLVLSVWDQLFGTYVRETQKPIFGITHPLKTDNPLWENLYYYAFLIQLSKRLKGLRMKLAFWFGTVSTTTNLFGKNQIDSALESLSQHNLPARRKIRSFHQVIVIGVFVIALATTILLMIHEATWSSTTQVIFSLGILSMITINGYILYKST
jgi:sterol desaturase/sphingolipid hydroxylase (fatty acid hydroxylase superfamily)